MKNSISLLVGNAFLFLHFTVGAIYPARTYNLENIEIADVGGYHRISLGVDGKVDYIEKSPSRTRLAIFLKHTWVKSGRKHIIYDRGLIKVVRAVQYYKDPPVAKVEIQLAQPANYTLQQIVDGTIYIDIDSGDLEAEQRSRPAKQNGSATPVENENSIPTSVNINTGHGKKLEGLLASTDRVSLDVKDADIDNVLRLISRQSGLNIVSGKDVSGRVTVALKNVTIQEALEMIVTANGYDYGISGEVIIVKSPEEFQAYELETRVFRLKFIDANNLMTAIEQVLSDRARVEVFYPNFQPTLKFSGAARQPGAGGGAAAPQTPAPIPGAGTAGGGQGLGFQQERSSTLVVTDLPANIRQLNALVQALDVPTPLVMIEAKLIEVSPQNQKNIGINWSKALSARLFDEVLLESGNIERFSSEVPLDGGGITYGTLRFDQYNAVINFLDNETNSKLVSNPRILAMDNHEATISVGNNVPIPQIARGVGGQGDIVTFDFRDVNISLNVTPHVAQDETITLHVNPVIEEITGEVRAGENSAPITSRREVETVVNLRTGETMVVGGLIRESVIETVSKVWLLGDIPLIGNLFRNKNANKQQTDLLIFITPRIVSQ